MFNQFFTKVIIDDLPPTPVDVSDVLPFATSTFDELLLEIATRNYWIVDTKTSDVFEGNSKLLDFCYAKFRRLHCRLIAKDGTWCVDISADKVSIGGISVKNNGLGGYTQAEIESKNTPYLYVVGDGLKDWLLFDYQVNPAQSYIVASHWRYIVFFLKNVDGLFYKQWELYNGMELTGHQMVDGLIHANEGFGFGDSTPFKIEAKTGDILKGDPCLKLDRYTYRQD